MAGGLRIYTWRVDVERGLGGHVLIDHEMVEDLRLVVEVKAAVRRAGDWRHEIRQMLASGK